MKRVRIEEEKGRDQLVGGLGRKRGSSASSERLEAGKLGVIFFGFCEAFSKHRAVLGSCDREEDGTSALPGAVSVQ